MPITIYPSSLKIKDTNGTFHGADCIKGDDYILTAQDKTDIAELINITDKADKVNNATSGNFAALDANGNLTDSGNKASDFLTEHQTIPVTDVQINGTSILNNGVANVPLCTGSNSPGVVMVDSDYGVTIATTGGATGKLYLSPPSNAQIKSGSNQFKPIVPSTQHTSTFYGLAKAAGDTTQAQSDNAVGTYTSEAKTAINNMFGSINKESFNNAGISSQTYTTKFGGEFTVTTVASNDYISPYARASVTGRIDKRYLHRVTINGTEYTLPTRLWYDTRDNELKVYEYLGNLGLYISDISGSIDGTDNVNFVVISDLNNSECIDVLTSTAGTYTIKIEQITPNQNIIPKSLIWNNSYVPIVNGSTGSTYNSYSMGVNEIKNARATFAFGYGNKLTAGFSYTLGTRNNANVGFAIGDENTVASSGVSIGEKNEASARSVAIGFYNKADELSAALGQFLDVSYGAVAVGTGNIKPIGIPQWQANTAYTAGQIVSVQNLPTPFKCKVDHTSSSSFYTDLAKWEYVDTSLKTDKVFIVGNGDIKNRSNALSVMFNGDTKIKGDVYVGCAADSTGGVKVATINDLPTVPVQDVQIDGTSVLSDGVANIPIASSSTSGVIKPGNGLSMYQGKLNFMFADNNEIKAGTDISKSAAVSRSHLTAFYGLAKAAGDSTQSQSNNTVGTYTDEAKAAIQTMLGVESGVSFVETISGTDVTITGIPNTRYVCNEVSTISITPPSTGTIIVRFTSGTTAAVLTLPSTVKMPDWWNGVSTNYIYQICIQDGVYGSVITWPI